MQRSREPTARLPIDDRLGALRDRLADRPCVVLEAPPGAGKTTRVPPALLDAPWVGNRRILVLEPRRLAARAAARYMAGARGEQPGETVGYRTRLETRVSGATRIEVVTEGILVRLLQSDPALSDYAAVLFDEFHERSLQADLGLALALEAQQALRPDLRLLVMSATLETAPVAALLGDAPVVSVRGRTHPVTVEYRPPRRDQRLVDAVAAAVRHALEAHAGSVLVFLPGVGEIRAVASRLDPPGRGVEVRPLYGALSPSEQDAAVAPAAPGTRKVVLATAIAETSLTIEGVRVVVDAGLDRRARFDPGAGMSRLVTTRVARAAADQRAGRAGRTEPGACIRLWSEAEQRQRPRHAPPEIAEADLAPLALELAQWGARSPDELAWLDPPPPGHWAQAVDLLQRLDALDAEGAITATGRAMQSLGIHPRPARMLVHARACGGVRTAAELAALLDERDVLGRDAGCDIEARLGALRHGTGGRRGRIGRVRRLADKLAGGRGDRADAGRLLATAFPDRVARRRPGGPARFLLANGRGAWLPDDDPLAGVEWLIAAELDGQAREARVFLAARTDRATIEDVLGATIERTEAAEWDETRGTVVVRSRRRLGALVLDESETGTPDADQVRAGLLDAVRRKGLAALNWTAGAQRLRHRTETLRRLEPDAWPAFDADTLMAELESWLGPFLPGVSRWRELAALDLVPALTHRLGHQRRVRLDRLAPPSLTVPAGQRVRLDYAAESGPVLAVKLQAVFGWRDTPRIADGRVPVVLHLLDPAGRPLAVTSDLASFWTQAYPEVAKHMRGRYPKHPWPDDPMSAEPTMRTKRRS